MSFRGVLAAIVLCFGMFFGWQFFKWIRSDWVPAGHVGLMYSATSGLEQKVYKPRRVYVPWLHKLYLYPTMTQAAVYTESTGAGESAGADGIQVNTNDNAQTTFDVTVLYHVNPTDVFTVFKEFGPIPIEDIQRLHIRRAAKEAANAVGTKFDAFGLMGTNRQAASDLMAVELRQRLQPKGITVDKVLLCSAFPKDQLLTKVTRRINSLTDLTIAGIKQQQSEVERNIAVTQATASAQAARLTSATTQARSLELQNLDIQIEAAKRWNGVLSPIQCKPGQIVNIPSGVLASMKATAEEEEKPAETTTPAAPAPTADAKEGDDSGN